MGDQEGIAAKMTKPDRRKQERFAAEDRIQEEYGLAAFGWDAAKCLAALAVAIKARKRIASNLRRAGAPTHIVDAELRMLKGGASTMMYHVKGSSFIGYCCGWPSIWRGVPQRHCSCGHNDPPFVPTERNEMTIKETFAECGCLMRESDPGIVICEHGSAWIGLGYVDQLRDPSSPPGSYGHPNTAHVRSTSDAAMARAVPALADILHYAARIYRDGFTVTVGQLPEGTE